jgi:HEAT repeat protein
MDDAEELLADCRSGEPQRQIAAITALRNFQTPAVRIEFARLIADATDAAVRAAAVEALSDVTEDTATIGQVLVRALDDDDELVRAEAADALGRLHYRPAGDALAALLGDDQSPVVRASAAESLGDIPDPAYIEQVVAAVQHDPDEAVRAYSAATLGLLGAGNETLQDVHINETSNWVRAELAIARYRRGAVPVDAIVAPFDVADRELAERLLNALTDLASRTPPPITSTNVDTVTAALSRLADRIPELQPHTRSVISIWRQAAT